MMLSTQVIASIGRSLTCYSRITRLHPSSFLQNNRHLSTAYQKQHVSPQTNEQVIDTTTVRIGNSTNMSQYDITLSTTSSRTHKFEVSADVICNLFRMNLINRLLGLDYTRLLANACKNAQDKSTQLYFADKAMIVLNVVLSSDKISNRIKVDTAANVASTSNRNLKTVLNIIKTRPDVFESANLHHFLTASYEFGDIECANWLINNYGSRCIQESIFDCFIECLRKASQTPSQTRNSKLLYIEHLCLILETLRDNYIDFNPTKVLILTQVLDFMGVSVKHKPIFESEQCTNCHQNLKVFDDKLVSKVNTIAKRLLAHDMESQPKNGDEDEINRFVREAQKIVISEPLDLVIDGLNIAHLKNNSIVENTQLVDVRGQSFIKRKKYRNNLHLDSCLLNFLEKINNLERVKRKLVFGTSQLKRWTSIIDYMKKNRIILHTCDAKSKDDLFGLYLASMSPKTMLASNDCFRDHAANLNHEEKLLILRWLNCRQLWVKKDSLDVIVPHNYERVPTVHRSHKVFHIPILSRQEPPQSTNEPVPRLNDKYVEWICCSYANL